jgi:phage baseplate assembly protein V
MQIKLSQLQLNDNVTRLAEYGLNSNPPIGTDCAVLFLAGDRSSGIVVATNNQTFRMRALASGEVAISDDKGQHVYLSADGIRINGGGLPISIMDTPSLSVVATAAINLTAPTVIVNGALQVNGPIVQAAPSDGGATASTLIGPLTVTNDVIASGTSVHGHHHTEHDGPHTSAAI